MNDNHWQRFVQAEVRAEMLVVRASETEQGWSADARRRIENSRNKATWRPGLGLRISKLRMIDSVRIRNSVALLEQNDSQFCTTYRRVCPVMGLCCNVDWWTGRVPSRQFERRGDIVWDDRIASSPWQLMLAFVRHYGSYMMNKSFKLLFVVLANLTEKNDGRATSENGWRRRKVAATVDGWRLTGRAGFKRFSRLGNYCLPYQILLCSQQIEDSQLSNVTCYKTFETTSFYLYKNCLSFSPQWRKSQRRRSGA